MTQTTAVPDPVVKIMRIGRCKSALEVDREQQFIAPPEWTATDLDLVHQAAWLRKLELGGEPPLESMAVECDVNHSDAPPVVLRDDVICPKHNNTQGRRATSSQSKWKTALTVTATLVVLAVYAHYGLGWWK